MPGTSAAEARPFDIEATPSSFAWTEDSIAALKRLFEEGLSAGRIAAELGVSRNTVIGKVHRLRLRKDGVGNDPFPWTDDRVATLRRMVKDGHTAFQIATEIGCPSRNAVLGKIHRLGLSADRPVRPQGGERRKVALTPMPKAVQAPIAKVAAVPSRPAAPTPRPIQPALPPPTEGVSIFDVKAFQCRWPVSGLGISIMFCAAPVKATPAGAPPCSWCAAHAAEAFVAVKGRVRG